MRCHNCGTINQGTATHCERCGLALAAPGSAAVPGTDAPSTAKYLIAAIVATLCCCLPFGIVAIVYAAQIDTKVSGGDLVGAQKAARLSLIWTALSAGIGILGVLAYFATIAIAAIFSGGLGP